MTVDLQRTGAVEMIAQYLCVRAHSENVLVVGEHVLTGQIVKACDVCTREAGDLLDALSASLPSSPAASADEGDATYAAVYLPTFILETVGRDGSIVVRIDYDGGDFTFTVERFASGYAPRAMPADRTALADAISGPHDFPTPTEYAAADRVLAMFDVRKLA